MSKQRIVIVGAGIGGSALGAILRKKDVAVTILDKNSKPPRHSYGLTLERSTLLPLLSSLKLDEASIVPKVRHPLLSPKQEPSSSVKPSALCVTRSAFEDLLRQDLDVQWNAGVAAVNRSSPGVEIRLDDGRTISADLLIAADGVHSAVRKALLPEAELKVLPYAVINGRTSLSLHKGQQLAGSSPQYADGGKVNAQLLGKTRLAYSIYEYGADKATVDFTFSRPAHSDDKVHLPNRPNSGARDIPEEFFTELERLQPLEDDFAQVFDPTSAREARLLHWLMRKSLMDRVDLDELAANGTILIGDAAHALPIIGGNGANEALLDSIQLANLLSGEVSQVAKSFYDSRYPAWTAASRRSEDILYETHSSKSSVL